MDTKNRIIIESLNWVNRVVIGLNLCPFAAPVVEQKSLHFVVAEGQDWASLLQKTIEECHFLDANDQYETSLVVLPEISDFDDYLDLLAMAEALLDEQGFSEVYQIASFHPDYVFADAEVDDPANFTNRSPYAMFHLIPEERLADAIEHYPDVDSIPLINQKLTRQKGLAEMKALRDSCFVGE